MLPRGTTAFDEKFQLLDSAGEPIKNARYAILKENGTRLEGITNAKGEIQLVQGFAPENLQIQILGRIRD